MQGMEEDELQNEALKMPSDLEGDDEEESEDEGLFPPDEEGSFPDDQNDYGQEDLKEAESDGEAEMDKMFAQANKNKEMDIVHNLNSAVPGQTSN